MMKEIGMKIRALRQELGLTQEALGEKVGLQKSAVAKYELGKIGTLDQRVLQRFSEALGVPASELMGRQPASRTGDEALASALRVISRAEVRAALQAQKVSYSELSARTGIPKSNLQRYLTTSKAIPPDAWEAILSALDLSPVAGSPIVLRTPHAVPAKPVNLIGVVRISEEAERELHRLAAETGLSLKAVASELIVQAAKICTIERR